MAKRSKSTFERLSGNRLNRKQRRELSRRIGAGDPSLSIVNPHAGGIDVGNESLGHERDGMVSLSWTRLTVTAAPVVRPFLRTGTRAPCRSSAAGRRIWSGWQSGCSAAGSTR